MLNYFCLFIPLTSTVMVSVKKHKIFRAILRLYPHRPGTDGKTPVCSLSYVSTKAIFILLTPHIEIYYAHSRMEIEF
jgi:hypothetical protein